MQRKVRCWEPLTKERIGSARSTTPRSVRTKPPGSPNRQSFQIVPKVIADFRWTERLRSKSGCQTPAIPN